MGTYTCTYTNSIKLYNNIIKLGLQNFLSNFSKKRFLKNELYVEYHNHMYMYDPRSRQNGMRTQAPDDI